MDPNANLQEQARLLAQCHMDAYDKARLRELRMALTQWFDGGGFHPSDKTGPAWLRYVAWFRRYCHLARNPD